jgi:hypothetical protein
VLTLLNKIFLRKQMIEMRDANFEHNCLIQSHIDGFECDSIRDRRMSIHRFDNLINCEFENDFHFDFAEHRHCVPRIDSNIDSSRDDSRIVIQSRIDFEHLNSDSDDFLVMARIDECKKQMQMMRRL